MWNETNLLWAVPCMETPNGFFKFLGRYVLYTFQLAFWLFFSCKQLITWNTWNFTFLKTYPKTLRKPSPHCSANTFMVEWKMIALYWPEQLAFLILISDDNSRGLKRAAYNFHLVLSRWKPDVTNHYQFINAVYLVSCFVF